MRKFLIGLILFQSLFAYWAAVPQVQNCPGPVEISMKYVEDRDIPATKDITVLYLTVANRSKYKFRIEPHSNSVLTAADGRRYYQKWTNSKSKFLNGFIPAGEERSGYLYFQSFRKPNTASFKVLIKNVKLYDEKSNGYDLNWEIIITSNLMALSQAARITDPDTAGGILPTSDKLEDLDYDTRLKVAQQDRDNYDKLNFKIELPAKIHRAENLTLRLYAPTITEVDSVTVLIGISNYVDLQKGLNGVFTGYFRIPELFELGTYVISFYIRFPDGRRTVRQKTIEIISY